MKRDTNNKNKIKSKLGNNPKKPNPKTKQIKKPVEKENTKFDKNKQNEEDGHNADFYLDDGDVDLMDFEEEEQDKGIDSDDKEEPGSDLGSELDFGPEDYHDSPDEEEDEEDDISEEGGKKQKIKKETKITKQDLKKIINKSIEGAPFALTKLILIFAKIGVVPQKLIN